ncbi:hypothetical protein J6590_077538 [Homalodisca vitripennis]|nr:hypothetical protein J6590_077538 [Homalodisca vitripennis]
MLASPCRAACSPRSGRLQSSLSTYRVRVATSSTIQYTHTFTKHTDTISVILRVNVISASSTMLASPCRAACSPRSARIVYV